MKVAVIIPARYASSRFPGKPLHPLRGRDGTKTLIHRTWERAVEAVGADAVWVATDDGRIAEAVRGFGGRVAMTSADCRNGTERCAEALPQLGDPDLVVNVQGDSPLTPPWFVTGLVDALAASDAGVATPVLRCDPQTHARLREDRAAGRVGGTTAVFGNDLSALYFSKEVVPFVPDGTANPPVFHHVGLYAYRPNALARYGGWPPGKLEEMEGLEQLRFLENGERILCVEVEARGRVFWELNNPVDVARIEEVL
ncbi:3-deoxy-manno-octulosonate cytidylyltransferase [Roseitranquillus sediminis]|uniref:3-deoxy-manno-octulosonate cytidylyltransferase n=1 Tax=Roseitranquillus sediminis TaxID=2809051 RepID=UPI001D0C6AAF|nr:3-deoxy-manno-octulosonate cytidylyltransferase [Roseitranquillus sediminis]MBM9593607.1 3-deoxy-manno-octulosonate cytidylyltransferase [Roseitranquillus sediminis]